MKRSEEITNLAQALKAAQDIQVLRLQQIRSETQVDIDKYTNQVVDLSREAIRRYVAFKSQLKQQGISIARDIWNVDNIDADALVPDSQNAQNTEIIFREDTNDSVNAKYLAIPLEYFDDPNGWENRLMKWIADIQELVARAPKVLGSHRTWSAQTAGRPALGDYFSIKGVAETTATGNFQPPLFYLVHYKTGNVYDVRSKENVEADNLKPFACLKYAK